MFVFGPSCAPEFPCAACESCDDSGECVIAPRTGCRVPSQPGKAQVALRNSLRNTSDSLTWTWAKGSLTNASDFGDPVNTDDYTLCIYQDATDAPEIVLRAKAPAGGTCGRRACWRGVGRPPGAKGFKYANRYATPDGLTRIDLRPGPSGKSRVVVRGKGPSLRLPPFPLTLPVLVQLQSENGECWEAEYGASGIRKNDSQKLMGKSLTP